MALRPDQPGWRPCLGGCDKKFRSRGAGHRICPKCERAAKARRQPRTVPDRVYVGGTAHPLTPDH